VFILRILVNLFGYAAKPIADRLEKKGGERIMPPEGFFVEGTEGPLKEGELERAADWAKQIMATR
jgi:flavodoxin